MDNSQNENTKAKDWIKEHWLNALILSALGLIFGAGGGAGMVGLKGVQAQTAGMSEDKADVKYLSNAEAQRLIQSRDRQIDEMKREIRADIDKTLKKETFDIWQKNWDDRQKYFDEKLDRILEK